MASDAGPLGPLTVASSSGFQQTGSWDMVNMAKIPITATLGALSRYAAGGVNPYTPLVGQTMCKALFRLKQQGRANMKQALSQLPCCSTLGSTLYFGFGIDNLVRIMATTEEGTICLAMCAALIECFSIETAGEVLLEMAKCCSIDGKYLPSNSEWEALLKSCAGVLTTTVFPLKCEGFMRLSQSGQLMRTSAGNFLDFSPESVSRRIPSTPESVADALLSISKVTRGELMAVTIAGGQDAGWLAAVAEWIFSLDVTIIRSSGDILYSNHRNNTAQVTIVFQNAEEGRERSLQIDSRTYGLKDASSILYTQVLRDSRRLSYGRVAWKTALSDVFGTDFNTLVSTAAFGTAVGSAARITRALARAEEGTPPFFVFRDKSDTQLSVKNLFHGSRSYGRSFVNNSIAWFPELERSKGDMEAHAESTLAGAISSYKSSVEALENKCDCSRCQRNSTAGSDATSSGNPVREVKPDPVYCLVQLLETIIRTSMLLSCCDIQENLCLSPEGLEHSYSKCEHRSRMMKRYFEDTFPAEDSEKVKDLCPLASCLDFVDGDMYGFMQVVRDVIRLFTHDPDEYSDATISAYSMSGVCVYLDILTNASADSESVSCIHVVTGHIELDGKSHTKLLDQELDSLEQDTQLEAAMTWVSQAVIQPPLLKVTERARDLRCSFSFPSSKDIRDQVSAPTIGPVMLTRILTASRKLVQCAHQLGHNVQTPGMLNSCDPTLFGSEGTRITFLPSRHSADQDWRFMATCAALEGRPRRTHTIIAVDHECMECCIKSAAGFKFQDVYFLGSRSEALRAMGSNVVGPFSLLPYKRYEEPEGEAEEQNNDEQYEDLDENFAEWEDVEDHDDGEGSEELEKPLPQDDPTFGDASAQFTSDLPPRDPLGPLPGNYTWPAPDTASRGTGQKTAKVQRRILRTSHFSVRPRR